MVHHKLVYYTNINILHLTFNYINFSSIYCTYVIVVSCCSSQLTTKYSFLSIEIEVNNYISL